MISYRDIFILLGLTLVLACQPEPLVLEDVPKADSKMVVSSLVGGEELVSILLTRSYGALDGDVEEDLELLEQFVVEDAQVFLRGGGQEVRMEEVGLGIYGNNTIDLIPGTEYELDVYNPQKGQSIKAKTTLMAPAYFSYLGMDVKSINLELFPEIIYGFDKVSGGDYYMINVQRVGLEYDLEDIISNRVFTHLIKDDSNQTMMEGSFTALFRDLEFGDTLMVSLSHISQSYYEYLDQVNNGFLGPSLITEPFNFSTNVSGGYGVFTMHYYDHRFIEVED